MVGHFHGGAMFERFALHFGKRLILHLAASCKNILPSRNKMNLHASCTAYPLMNPISSEVLNPKSENFVVAKHKFTVRTNQRNKIVLIFSASLTRGTSSFVL